MFGLFILSLGIVNLTRPMAFETSITIKLHIFVENKSLLHRSDKKESMTMTYDMCATFRNTNHRLYGSYWWMVGGICQLSQSEMQRSMLFRWKVVWPEKLMKGVECVYYPWAQWTQIRSILWTQFTGNQQHRFTNAFEWEPANVVNGNGHAMAYSMLPEHGCLTVYIPRILMQQSQSLPYNLL